MTRSWHRLTLAVAIGGAALLGSPAGAGFAPQLIDPAGDSLGGQTKYDIVSGTFSTTGVTTTRTARGKKERTYTPTALVVTLELAAPPGTNRGDGYQFRAEAAECGFFILRYHPGAVARAENGSLITACGGAGGVPPAKEAFFNVNPTVAGNTITWVMKLSTLPRDIRVGTTFTNFVAYAGLVDPVIGLYGTHRADGLDSARSSASWTLG